MADVGGCVHGAMAAKSLFYDAAGVIGAVIDETLS
jgi:hypothetical protein